ncbi:MAG: iron-containing redox enzyme family protein [Thermodesulfobacteriota bacterium]
MSEISRKEAEAYVHELCRRAENHPAVNHPYLQNLATGNVPDVVAALKDFAGQYYAYSSDFLRYLTATIAQMEERKHREALMANLVEETGQVGEEDASELDKIGIELEWIDGVAHPLLYRRFLKSLGLDDQVLAAESVAEETLIWREMFLDLCLRGEAAQSLGAIGLGTENIVKFIYRPILAAIKEHLDISPRERVFFDLHAALDDEHGAVLTEIAVDYAEKSAKDRQELKYGMLKALSIRGAFFDAMQKRADSMTPTD